MTEDRPGADARSRDASDSPRPEGTASAPAPDRASIETYLRERGGRSALEVTLAAARPLADSLRRQRDAGVAPQQDTGGPAPVQMSQTVGRAETDFAMPTHPWLKGFVTVVGNCSGPWWLTPPYTYGFPETPESVSSTPEDGPNAGLPTGWTSRYSRAYPESGRLLALATAGRYFGHDYGGSAAGETRWSQASSAIAQRVWLPAPLSGPTEIAIEVHGTVAGPFGHPESPGVLINVGPGQFGIAIAAVECHLLAPTWMPDDVPVVTRPFFSLANKGSGSSFGFFDPSFSVTDRIQLEAGTQGFTVAVVLSLTVVVNSTDPPAAAMIDMAGGEAAFGLLQKFDAALQIEKMAMTACPIGLRFPRPLQWPTASSPGSDA